MKITKFEESFQTLLRDRAKNSHHSFVILAGGRYSQGDVTNRGISTIGILVRKYLEKKQEIYCQISNIRCILIGNKIVDHSDAVGASPVSAASTIILNLSPDFNRLCRDKCKTKRENLSFVIWCTLY